MKLKLGTWNLMLPVADRRRDAIRLHTDREQADVWVLTETHDGFTPGHLYSHSSAEGRDGRHKREHRWVTIWSRCPMTPLFTSDVARTAAARITPDTGAPFVVYGTVLPWLGSAWLEHPGAGGVAFREAVKAQGADWIQLRREYPEDEFFVLGDFNQDLVREQPRYYGTAANRAALEAALDSAGLVALTAGGGDPIRRESAPCACIDHICARRDSAWRAEAATRWPDRAVPDRTLTDHFGVSISLERS
jgi:hypothetical protein